MKAIASTKLPTISSWSVTHSEVISVLCIQIHRKLAKQEKKSFRKVQAKHLLKVSEPATVSRAPERCIGILKCWMHGQTCGTRWWKKKRGSRSRIPRKNSKRACLQRGGSFPRFGFHSPTSSRQYLKLACPFLLNESLSKLQQFQKRQAEIQDTAAEAHWHG